MQKDLLENNVIPKLSFHFSWMVINYCELLDQEKKYTISKQLFRSATSIVACQMEAQKAESKAGFIHKIKLSAKEGDETQYWLLSCDYAEKYPACKHLLLKLNEIQKVLNKIIGTAKCKTPIRFLLSFFIL